MLAMIQYGTREGTPNSTQHAIIALRVFVKSYIHL
jgi:hypothetical protein